MMHFQTCVNGVPFCNVRLDDLTGGFYFMLDITENYKYKNTESRFTEVLGFIKKCMY